MPSTQSHMCRGSKVGYKNIHVIIKYEQSELGKLKLNSRERTCYNLMWKKRTRKKKIEPSASESSGIFFFFFEKIALCLPFIASLRSDYMFSLPEEDRLFISSIFKVRIFNSKKCQPPPPPHFRIKWLSLGGRTVSLYYRTAWWKFTKCGREEVLMTLNMCCDYRPDPSRGRYRAGKNRSWRNPF